MILFKVIGILLAAIAALCVAVFVIVFGISAFFYLLMNLLTGGKRD